MPAALSRVRTASFLALSIGLLLALAGSPAALAQDAPSLFSHADHTRAAPLQDALDLGASSIEVDVYLLDNEIRLGATEGEAASGSTFESLYLKPLRSQKWSDRTSPLQLMLDVHSDARTTYAALDALLQQYADVLTIFTFEGQAQGAVSILLSGNRPMGLMGQELVRYVAAAGTLDDLFSGQSTALVPVVVDTWSRLTSWCGDGPMPEVDQQRLLRIMHRAQETGQSVTFTEVPAHPAVWSILVDAGVQTIPAEDLQRLSSFLLANNTSGPAAK